MPSLFWTSFLAQPRLLGEHGLMLIWILPLSSIHHLRNRISQVILIPFYSLAIVGLPTYSPESAPLGSPFVIYITTFDALSLHKLPCWICLPFCTLPGNCTRSVSSIVWCLLALRLLAIWLIIAGSCHLARPPASIGS